MEKILNTIEDFEQYLNSCKRQKEETPADDIGSMRDIDSDIERYETVIEALKFQLKYKGILEERSAKVKTASEIIDNIIAEELEFIADGKREIVVKKICKALNLENVQIMDLSDAHEHGRFNPNEQENN